MYFNFSHYTQTLHLQKSASFIPSPDAILDPQLGAPKVSRSQAAIEGQANQAAANVPDLQADAYLRYGHIKIINIFSY